MTDTGGWLGRVKPRRVAELTIAVMYAVGALNQAFDVLNHSVDFYRAMADQAWLPSAEAVIEELLIPNSTVVTLMVAALEAILAVAIFMGRSAVRPALIVGGLFSVAGALTGNPIETVGYGLLAALHFWLAWKRGTDGDDPRTAPTG